MSSAFRLQQYLNDLLKNAGHERITQEQLSALVAAAAEKPAVSQTQVHRAIKHLSHGNADTQLIRRKYEDIKKKDLCPHLDRVLVLLSRRTAGDSWVTGTSSSSAAPPSTDAPTPAPAAAPAPAPAVPETRSRSQVDQLAVSELREALKREVGSPQPTVAAAATLSARLQQQQGGAPRQSSPYPVPDWLAERPYMTRGLVTAGPPADRLAPALAPLGDLPIATQEATVIEDVLFCLSGVDGEYISVSQGDCRIDGTIDPALQETVRQISPLFAHFATVMAFAEESTFVPGQVVQALGAALRSHVKNYLVLIAQLETQHRAGELTMQRLWFYLQPSLRTMEILADVADTVFQHGLQSGQILSLLHDRCLTGDERTQQLCLHLVQAAAVPYMRILESWIYKGSISDPYREFLVEDNEVSGRERLNIDYSDDYWEKRYTIAPHKIPTFLAKVADKLLRTGKYLNVIRQCDENLRCPEAPTLVYSPRERHYVDAIDRAYAYSSKTLLRLLMDAKDLMGRLRSVKHYYLMDQGDFIVQFMDLCEPELQKNISDILPTKLENLLDLALRTSAAKSDPYKDDLRPELLGYDLNTQMMKIHSIETYEEKEHWAPAEHLAISGLQAFTFGSAVTWPVSLVLNRKALACYQMMFRHLFYCKHVERQLCQLWVSNKVVKQFADGGDRGYAPAFALRQRMLTSVQNLLYYMTSEVVEPSWQNFIAKMQQVTNVDEVLQLHNDLLNGCMRDCMLTRPELLRTVSRLLTVCVTFVSFLQSPEPEEASDSVTFAASVAEMDAQFTSVLLTLLDNISDFGRENYNAKLISILYRLDFNGFYTEQLEQRAGARSHSASSQSGLL
ncbi:gamma-tubulin complex component 2-like [Amphibalanus amphitrite]|uniref:gamma-tubulin complex component 2-like n=1 Tax=Amphibalanus amphitrite TaxID=1232801 RepID=UPI001C9101D5|nr:gamma-tubulin complex component 2-like [Amphibalanus amphitrite]XP_043228486.1 gamma-tubulin complex component 2-like [Amphibalanus amphitrite]XP_043228487.1 gamma-tubulin complex component 2-like [Amphibalanus amphitrite]